MALTQYTADTDIIETLGTNPEDRPTLTDDTFKAKFDENSENIKVFLNAMIAELLSTAAGKGASQIGIEDSAGRYTATQIEAALAEIAGSGRTTETVKSLADLISTHTADLITDANGAHGLKAESGTFTPTLVGGTTAGTLTYSYQTGEYCRVGKIVTCGILLAISAKNTMAGVVRISGLPFVAAGDALKRYGTSMAAFENMSGLGAQKQIGGYLQGGDSAIYLTASIYNGATQQVTATQLDNTFSIQFSITYETV